MMMFMKMFFIICLVVLGGTRPALASSRSQSQAALNYRVEEERPASTLVGDVRDDSHLRAMHDDATLAQLRFQLHQTTAAANEYFLIDTVTGELRTRTTIDRDALCRPLRPHCDVLNVDVMVTPYAFFEIIKVKVKVIDVNDRKPTFPTDRVEFRVLETAAVGTSFPLPSAEDGDLGNNSVQAYAFAPDQPTTTFELQTQTQSDGSLTASLVLRQQLDHEQADFHRLKIVANDGGKPPLSGSLLVDVIVLDANDNRPVFGSAVYEAQVFENALPGSEVVRLSASDADSGAYGEVSFAFSAADELAYGQTFRIDNRTGMVYVRGSLDHETQRDYVLTVEATDKGFNSKPTKTRLVIQVLDINDNAPEIQQSALTPSGFAEIAENLEVGTFVAYITVRDPDSGANGQFDCSINSAYFTLRNEGSTDYHLISDAVFDREERDSYDVRLTCTDYGDRRLTSELTIRVKVLDANDHTPKFSQAVYHVYLSENNVVGATIVKLNATDEDVGKNGALHYSIHPSNISENSKLAVDSVTGMVRALEQFDYEVKRVYEFVITATDHGDIARSATATLLLEIVDTNDESPVFVGNQPYIFHLLENRPPNYLIGTVTATDADAYPNNQVTYAIDYIDETSPSIGHFNIDSFAGRLYAKLPLDREKTAVHKFRVVASNVGFSHMRTYADVFVHVTDENDNAPTVLFPNKHNRTLRVSPSAPQGAIVGWVEARDPDNGQNGTLSYDVTNLATQPVFVVSATSGAILVVGDVSELDQHVVRLRIKVTDNGVPPRAAEAETDLWIAVNGSTGQWQAKAAVMGSGLLLMGQTEFLVIIAIIVGILMTAVVIATITCCLRGGNRHIKRQQGGGMAVGGGGAKGETDKFLPSKATDDKYSVVVNVNGTNGLLRPHEALAMQRSWRTDPDLELNAIGVSTFTLPQENVVANGNTTLQRQHQGAIGSQPCLCNGHVSPVNGCYGGQRSMEPPKKIRISSSHVHVPAESSQGGGDKDSESACSGCTDSGRGLSEEGDSCHVFGPGSMPPKCPPVRETKNACQHKSAFRSPMASSSGTTYVHTATGAAERGGGKGGGGYPVQYHLSPQLHPHSHPQQQQQPLLMSSFTAHPLSLGRLNSIDRLGLGSKNTGSISHPPPPPPSKSPSRPTANPHHSPELDRWLQTSAFYSADMPPYFGDNDNDNIGDSTPVRATST